MSRAGEAVLLRWPGANTLGEARAAMRSGRPVEIELPLETHHALCTRLGQGRLDAAEASGGAQMLALLAAVAGLEGLERLAPAVRKARYRVRLTTPDPVLTLAPDR
jgi:hypothetical protein